MLKPRYEWECNEPGCCVFMGGTADFDIYMADCHVSPHDPHVLFVGYVGLAYEFKTIKKMDESMPSYRDYHDYDALLAAQVFVHLFFPNNTTTNGETK